MKGRRIEMHKKKGARRNNKKRRKAIRPELLICVLFIMSIAFYCITKIGFKSYNITLQQQEQTIAAEVLEKKEAVSELETEVNNLQNKTRLLGMLDSSVKDNQNNIYIME